MSPEDIEIVSLFKQGGSFADKAFNQLVNSYGEQLYRQIRRIVKNHELTNDTLQNVLIKVYKNLSSFKGESTLYTWMYRIANNEALNTLEKEKRRTGVDIDSPALEILAGHQGLDSISEERIEDIFNKAIESLPEKQALVFELKYFQDMKYQDISVQLNTSVGALKASFHHAKQKIEEFVLNELNL